MIIVYFIGILILFYAILVFLKLPISRAFFMVVVSVLLTGFIMSVFFNRFNNIDSVLYIPLSTFFYGLMGLFIAPWAYCISALIALMSVKKFKKQSFYILFGAFLGAISLALIMVIFLGLEHFRASFLLIGALVGFLTLLIDTKIYKF